MMIDQIIKDIKKTHIILNAEAGHGKSTSLMTIIKKLKEQEPRTIVKVFDVSQAWFHRAPLPYRQRICFDMMRRIAEQGRIDFRNLDNCVYEMGELTEELRRFLVAIIIKQDYDVRREMGYRFGKEAVDKLPKIVYVFEEADTYFDSASLNKKDEASATLRDFIKVGRNFGLRAFCVVTATVGELGTKLRRRSKHIIGKIISDSDYREYNRMKKGLGKMVLGLPRFHWIYFNGEASEPFKIPDLVEGTPVDFEVEGGSLKQLEVIESQEMSTFSKIVLALLVGFMLAVILFRL